ncbi:hypothetical protein DNTS_020878 [Danionella cerebrum]|uniref:RAD9, HUS1, RAD1-interacting nuclear orphan protein 1 n=1 Tax=Danionella cerebrum TaxID=2873325 RepID=A0A553QLI5_9TELE|nr:hypothetical protein DNTS_020878 [Danionella translucida]
MAMDHHDLGVRHGGMIHNPNAIRKTSGTGCRLLNPLKSQLLFKEAPINGARHECGPQLHSAIVPRTYISDKQRSAKLASSWVSPQFTSITSSTVTRGGQRVRKKQRLPRISNKASVSCLSLVGKAPFSRYTRLSFEPTGQELENVHRLKTANKVLVSSEIHRKEHEETSMRTCFSQKGSEEWTRCNTFTSCNQKKVSNTPVSNINGEEVRVDLMNSPNTSSVPDPPTVETPEMPHCSSTSPSSVHLLLFPPNLAKTPPRKEQQSLLVPDTPEKDYALRVTWRRRKNLMKQLIDRGRLLLKDTQVAYEWK